MKLPQKQHGATMWQTCVYILLFLFVVTTALKLGPVYLQDRNIKSALNAINQDATSDITDDAIKNRLYKTFQVSMIDEKLLKDVIVDRTSEMPVLMMDYEVRVPFAANIDVVVSFSHAVNLTSAR
jgi:hypothetical protein